MLGMTKIKCTFTGFIKACKNLGENFNVIKIQCQSITVY